ncbi:MAG TPA: DEAD/DEAH box helicase [Polyangia bacterium]|nr:DEAD/DEAH box helicase [Polyangia bacterium]
MSPPARSFSSLPIHPALARALAARGYDTSTPVQAAVLDRAHAGRDLLISSQTGSGKTIAFGTLLVETLLGDAPTFQRAPDPAALVIVPTRELAAQVREELGWLLHDTGLRAASFTGGTGIGGDLRALGRGVDLVIGTPGRLVDLVRRQRLNLASLRMVVLDEADEMLDLGFRDDLETLLGAAPVDRRTVLLSATLPAEIRALARRFQRDAVAVDPRRAARDTGVAPAGGAAHEDIAYVAHLVAAPDRLAAVVNVLRIFDLTGSLATPAAARAIVFGTTREGVAALHAALVARGFAATMISGDRAQADRDRALEQMRHGEARVLVATNVAARGLHLPDVDLIVHADLPLNAESLAHRSGRTGRAGRKGTAVLIVGLHERRKAERLLSAIGARATWSAAPSPEAIAAAARQRLVATLLEDTDTPATGPDDVAALLHTLEGRQSPGRLLARLLSRELARLPVGEPLTSVAPPAAASREPRPSHVGPRRSQSEFASDGVVFRINLGAKDRADPRWMLPLICRRGGVTRREVGAIRIGARDTTFEIAGDAAHDFSLASARIDPRAPHVRIDRADARPRAAPKRR